MSDPGSERRRANQDPHISELLVRLDERTSAMATNMAEMRHAMVTQAEFKPIRMVIYGLVAILLTSVVGAIVATVLKA